MLHAPRPRQVSRNSPGTTAVASAQWWQSCFSAQLLVLMVLESEGGAEPERDSVAGVSYSEYLHQSS